MLVFLLRNVQFGEALVLSWDYKSGKTGSLNEKRGKLSEPA